MEQLKLTESEKIEYLRKIECTTKEDLLNRVSRKIDIYGQKVAEGGTYPQEYYTLVVMMLTAFYEKIAQAVLFDRLPDYWAYFIDYSYDEFVVNMYHMSSFEVDEDMAIRKSKTDALYKLIHFKLPSCTVQEYADTYGVEQGTVRQWIRRGKIRTAFKEGTEWKIPYLTPTPSRGYERTQYKWIEGLTGLPEEYQYLNDYVIVTFFQDPANRSMYHALFVSKEAFVKNDFSKNLDMMLTAKEREKLELFMIANPQIKYCGLVI